MMEQQHTTKTYRLENLDCAVCAAKIESGLNKSVGIANATVSFATRTVHVDAEKRIDIPSVVRRIEPNVNAVADDMGRGTFVETDDSFNFRKELLILFGAGILFLILMVFEDRIRSAFFPGAEYFVAIVAYALAGWNVFLGAWRTIRQRVFFDENILMTIATVGAFIIGALDEAVGVMIFYKVGELLQGLAVARSRRSIYSLLAIRPAYATIEGEQGMHRVAPEDVEAGTTIIVKPGEKVPLDGVVINGQTQVDTSALTGESVPMDVEPGGEVLGGAINLSGTIRVRVTKVYQESSIAKVMHLVENAIARKAKTEKFVTSFAKYYTPAVVAVALAIAFIPPVILPDATFRTWVYRALVLLVISCPCALVVSIPLGYFGGIGKASRRGILVKGSNYIDALSGVDTVVFDKTGTLTYGKLEVSELYTEGAFDPEQLLEFAAYAEYHSNHPVAQAIVKDYYNRTGKTVDTKRIDSHTEIAGKGVKANIGGRSVVVGTARLMADEGVGEVPHRPEGVGVNVVVEGQYAGSIRLEDKIRSDGAATIAALRQQGVAHMVMLTGDNRATAKKVAEKLGIDQFYAELLPEDKVEMLDSILANSNRKGKIVFVGDGINDAPVIARADIGMAMGALGSDVAIETADIVLMTDSLRKIPEAIAIARKTRTIVWQNVIMALSIKGIFVVLGTFGFASMWEAVFADMGTALLAIVNAMRIFAWKSAR